MKKVLSILVLLFFAFAMITPAYALLKKNDKPNWQKLDPKSNGKPFDALWDAIVDLQNQINNIPAGLQGPKGDKGDTGTCSCAITEDMYNTLLTRITALEASMPSIEVCDGKDNDIDGLIDEGFDFQTDEANCGSCNTVCGVDQICNLGTCTSYEDICTPEEEATIAQYLSTCRGAPNLCLSLLIFDTNLNTECKDAANALFDCAITSTCLTGIEPSESFACLQEQCAETTFAVFGFTPEGFPCDDGDFCTTNDVWQNGVCTSQSFRSCNDSNECTTDSCNSGLQSCTNTPIEDCVQTVDEDSDGYPSTVDCNDDNPEINPGAQELCNLMDDDCDGSIDEGSDICGIPDLTCVAGECMQI